MSVNAAMTYYETVGQNWERAALIKARPIGGDIYAGYEFLKRLSPFIWRKYLDFVAIDDIQSIKRQMDAYHQSTLKIEGHNIKIGIGVEECHSCAH
jgi:glutamate-ammonia-ligase adenylyltransferase